MVRRFVLVHYGRGKWKWTNRVTPIIYLGITFIPSYSKQSNSFLHKRRQKFFGTWAKLTWVHGLLFFYFFIFRLLTFQGWRNKFVASWSNFTWGRGRGMADSYSHGLHVFL
jgi:hypothetical protein